MLVSQRVMSFKKSQVYQLYDLKKSLVEAKYRWLTPTPGASGLFSNAVAKTSWAMGSFFFSKFREKSDRFLDG